MITTERTSLRPFRKTDIDDMHLVLGHPEVMRFSTKDPLTREETKEFLNTCISNYQKNGSGLYAIEHKVSKKVIGYCGFYFQIIDSVKEIEIGYRLNREYWNLGIATETSKAIQNYGFNEMGYTRLISIIESENRASVNVALKNGLKLEKETTFKNIPVQIYVIEKQNVI